MRKVISYCLYGDKEIYIKGAIENAKQIKEIYGDTWEGWFYICENIDKNIINNIKKYARVIIIKNDFWLKTKTLWRLLPLDEDIELFISRDVDSRLSIREKNLVDEWIKSDKLVHIIRDNPIHNFRMMTGMIGFKKNNIGFREVFNKYNQYNRNDIYIMDQKFLQEIYYPLIKDSVLIHDSYHKYSDELANLIPIQKSNNFIGEKVYENNLTDKEIMVKKSKNKYILFLEELDCFNTEQCCAFLYKLMEYIQIARKTNRTLVLPNIYLTPRDNKKIISEKNIVIIKSEYISIDNFLDIDELKKCCNIITPTDYYQYILDNNIKSILINKPKKEIPFINNKLFTYIGKLPILDNIEYDFNSLNILNLLMNELVKDFEAIIIYDYNRMGNPNWINTEELEYFGIRHNIIFKDYLKEMADEYVKNNKIREIPTLMFHWRRGDKANINTTKFHMIYTEETKKWFDNFDKICSIKNVIIKLSNIIEKYNIKQLLLITNNEDKKELEDFNFLLNYKKVKLIELNNNSKYINLDYNVFDIFSILVGAQCEYHIHSPSNYYRMSMFGRWMLEERNIYYFHHNWFYNLDNKIMWLY